MQMSEQQEPPPIPPSHMNPSNQFRSPQHQEIFGRGYQDHPDGGHPAGGYRPQVAHRQGFQDFPGGEEEQPPQISADISDIARWVCSISSGSSSLVVVMVVCVK